MGIVPFQREVFVAEGVDFFDRWVQLHHGQGAALAGELELGLLEVVLVEVEVAEGVDEFAGLEVADLGGHHGEQGVAGDVEGHAEEEIGAALVQLAAQLAAIDKELKQAVAGWKGHLLDVRHVPGTDDVAAAVRVRFDAVDEAGDLIVRLRLRCALPAPPLRAIDGTEVAVFIGPFIPNGDFVVAQVLHVGVSLQEPEQFMNDGAQVQLLGGDEREGGAEIVAALLAKNGVRARAGAVLTVASVIEHFAQQAVVFFHRPDIAGCGGDAMVSASGNAGGVAAKRRKKGKKGCRGRAREIHWQFANFISGLVGIGTFGLPQRGKGAKAAELKCILCSLCPFAAK
jgi:hypothetical protein